jgi:hypothetical protein
MYDHIPTPDELMPPKRAKKAAYPKAEAVKRLKYGAIKMIRVRLADHCYRNLTREEAWRLGKELLALAGEQA